MVDGTAGTVPVRSDYYSTSNWWGVIGVNMNIPCSMDFYTAPRRRRQYFVRKPMRSTPGISGIRSCGVTAQLLAEAKLSFQLAQARYRLGLSSIVELSQA
jgi:outer membrane protein